VSVPLKLESTVITPAANVIKISKFLFDIMGLSVYRKTTSLLYSILRYAGIVIRFPAVNEIAYFYFILIQQLKDGSRGPLGLCAIQKGCNSGGVAAQLTLLPACAKAVRRKKDRVLPTWKVEDILVYILRLK